MSAPTVPRSPELVARPASSSTKLHQDVAQTLAPSTITSPLCAICSTEESRYTCPRCHIRTCSLACSTKHKALGAGCSGVRNKAAYVPPNQYGYMALMDDYVFLEEVGRKVGEWGKEIVTGGYLASGTQGDGRGRGGGRGRMRGRGRGAHTRSDGPRSKREVLKMALDNIDIEMELLPVGMERRTLNQSTWDARRVTVRVFSCVDHLPASSSSVTKPLFSPWNSSSIRLVFPHLPDLPHPLSLFAS